MLIPKSHQRIKQYLHFLDARKYEPVATLQMEVAETQNIYRSVPHDLTWRAIEVPFRYGRAWTTFWFRTRYRVSEQDQSKELYLHFTPHAETLVFVNGVPVSAVNMRHEKFKLTSSATPGTLFEIALETYSGHPYPGMHPFGKPSIMISLETASRFPQYPLTLSLSRIVSKNQAVYDLYYDAWLLFELAEQLPDESLRKNRILQELFYSLSQIYFTASATELQEQVREARRSIQPLLALKNSSTTPTIFTVGHAHIDHAWLWPIRETHRKVARTFACMSQYAQEFSDFVFIQTQPAQLEALHTQYPDIFEQVQQAYQRGQWEPNGGMYVEADCNIPNGESLIRQFLVGRLTTEALLNYTGDTLWLPDVFGYSANLPQILAGCGIKYFVTSKINWNDTTRFPYDTFIWKGIDDTSLSTHYITSRQGGYNGKITPFHVFNAWNEVQHKEVQSGVIFPIGEGDGGGGTMRADLELARRMSDLEGCPRVKWVTASDALQEIFQEARDLPEWRGELYLELHRGTYTSQAKTKMWNRRLEYALREVEILSTLTMPSVYHNVCGQEGGLPYPAEQILSHWKTLLIQQFHDIIPGSSIKEVYDDALQSYETVSKELEPMIHSRRQILSGMFDTSQGAHPVFCTNSLSWERDSMITIPHQDASEPYCLVSGDRQFPVQRTKNLSNVVEDVALVNVPALGGQVYYRQSGSVDGENNLFHYENNSLRTPFYQVQFDEAMRISSLVDHAAQKEYVPSGLALNTLQTADDVPIAWDAWDLDVDYQLKLTNEDRLLSTEVISNGPLFIQIRNHYQIGKRSTLMQDVMLYATQKRIDFVTQVDWQEDHQLLKVLFPVAVHSTKVKCEIQYGHVERHTHSNTYADRAQFEFCAHKWIALDDGSFGAALLNNCKYGYDVNGSGLRLTLLKSAKAPDPEADMGIHNFTYAFLPYQGAFRVEEVVRQGYDLNIPLTPIPVERRTGQQQAWSAFQIDNPNIILEMVKKAGQDDGMILRLYEASGGEQRMTLTTAFTVQQAFLTNMLEGDVVEELEVENGEIHLTFRGFEIKTVKLLLRT